MTVSERSIGTLTTALQDWLTDRLGRPGQLTVSGVRTPGSGGLSSTSALFEANWVSQGTRQGGAYVARMAPEDSAVPARCPVPPRRSRCYPTELDIASTSIPRKPCSD
jgi:hypothetical protein